MTSSINVCQSHSFVTLHSAIHPRAVTEFSYRFSSPEMARVFISFQVNSASRLKEVQGIVQALGKENMTATDISDDEMAKTHARYMIGGRSSVPNERVFRFGELWDR